MLVLPFGATLSCTMLCHAMLTLRSAVLCCALCRSLKEDQGLSNSSEEVQEAVEQLLDLKAELQMLKDAAAAADGAAAEEAADAPAA